MRLRVAVVVAAAVDLLEAVVAESDLKLTVVEELGLDSVVVAVARPGNVDPVR